MTGLASPKWILSHVLMVVAVIVMILLGFWQLDRLQQKRDRNAEIESRLDEPVTAVTDLVGPDDPYDVGTSVRYRLATASGVYQVDDEILIRNRTLEGSAGFWLVTPLLLDDGAAVAVNRGWVPFDMGASDDLAGTEPPGGAVTIEGLVRETVTAGLLQSDDPSEGVLQSLARVDLQRYEEQLGYPLLPVYLQLEAQEPPQSGALPVLLPRPELDEGPHLSYAVQWFSFATIATVGYIVLLLRLAGRDGRGRRPSQVPVDYL